MKNSMFCLIVGLLINSSTTLAECKRVQEDEYKEMQQELLLQNVTDVNTVMHQRIDFCDQKCPGTNSEGLCILKADTKKPKKKGR